MGARLEDAVVALRRGGLVVYPTDTLYALGARADRPGAVRRLLHAKGRSASDAVSFAVSSYEEVERWARLTARTRAEVRRRLPGPYTLILPASELAAQRFHTGLIGPRGTVGVRVPDHPVARELARATGPIVCTSANRHGTEPARSIPEARRAFGSSVATYLGGRPAPRGRPSEIFDLSGPRGRVVARR